MAGLVCGQLCSGNRPGLLVARRSTCHYVQGIRDGAEHLMGQGLVGADVGDLRRLSAVMDAEAEKITSLQQQLTAMIQKERTGGEMTLTSSVAGGKAICTDGLGAAAVCLRTNARALKLNAEQQEQASLGGSAGGSKGGPSGGSGRTTPGSPEFTFDPTTYGPVTVEGNGSIDSKASGETHGSIGPGRHRRRWLRRGFHRR